VLSDAKGHCLDAHCYVFDQDGRNIQGMEYEPRDLKGLGVIGQKPVKCTTPRSFVKFYTGHAANENDYKDVLALCRKFGTRLLPECLRFTNLNSLSRRDT
jgi:hypothetical protein